MLNSTGINLKVAHSFKFIYHKENHCCQEVFLQANQVPCAVVQACSLHHGTWLSELAPLDQDVHIEVEEQAPEQNPNDYACNVTVVYESMKCKS